MSEDHGGTRVPVFKGTKKDWVQWSEVFLARAKRRGYKELLTNSENLIPKSGFDLSEEEKRIQELNEVGYGDLILAMGMDKAGGKVAFNLVKKTKTTDYKDGNINVAWKNLTNKYCPTSAPSLTRITKTFYSAKMKEKTDPDLFITHLEDLRDQMEEMGSVMTDKQFVVHVLNNLPKDFEQQVVILEKKMDDEKSITIEEVREDLLLKFERISVNPKDDEEEVAMVAGGNSRRCHQCGKIGHIARFCKDRNKNNKSVKLRGSFGGAKKFEGECFYCKKKGHRMSDCYKKQRDEGRSSAETAEVVLTTIDSDFAQLPQSCVPSFIIPDAHELLHQMDHDFCMFSMNLPQGMFPSQDIPIVEDDASTTSFDMRFVETKADSDFIQRMNEEDSYEDPFIHDDDSEAPEPPCPELYILCQNLFEESSEEGIPQYLLDSHDALYEVGEDHGDFMEATRYSNLWSMDISQAYLQDPPMSEVIDLTFEDPEIIDLTEPEPATDHEVVDLTAGEEDPLPEVVDLTEEEDEEPPPKRVRFDLNNSSDQFSWYLQQCESILKSFDAKIQCIKQCLQAPLFPQETCLPNLEVTPECETALVTTTFDTFTRNTWLADSGASTHMGNCDKGMINVKYINAPVKIGNAKHLTATKIGDKHLKIIQKDGTMSNYILKNYKYVPELWVNLFSIPQALMRGWNIGNKGVSLFLTHKNHKIMFDCSFKTPQGLVIGCEAVPHLQDSKGFSIGMATMDYGREMPYSDFHSLLGHPSSQVTNNTAKYLSVKLHGETDICEICALSKTRQKNTQKQTSVLSTYPGECLFIDISSIKQPSYGGSKFWCLIVDDFTGYCWNYFLKQKSDQVDLIVALIKDLKAKYNRQIKYICCDNAGENTSLDKRCSEEGLGIQFE